MTKLESIARLLGPHKHDHAALVSTARALLGEPMGDDVLIVAVALGLLALYTSVANGTGPDGVIQGQSTWTPNDPPPIGPANPPPSGGSVGPVNGPTSTGSGDMIDPNGVQIVNAPDFRGWPITARITNVTLEPTNCKIHWTGENSWEDTFPPGFADPIQFTVWAFVFIGGQWVCSGFIEGVGSYKGSDGVGDGVFDFVNNWWYSGRWAPMTGHAIQPGETIGLMLTGGDARDEKGPYTGQRTQIVAFQAADSASYSF